MTHKVTIGGVRGFLTANVDEHGDLIELFVHGFGSFGSTHQGWTDSFGILMSAGVLQADPTTIERLRVRFAQMRFEPNGLTDNEEIPECESIPDYIFKWLALNFNNESKD